MSRARLTRDAAEAALRQAVAPDRGWAPGPPVDVADVLRRLPDDVDPALVVEVVRPSLESSPSLFARGAKELPPAVVRRLLETTPRGNAAIVLLRDAVPLELDDATLAARWREALATLVALDTSYEWGSQPKRAKFQELARGPWLASIQAAVVGSEAPPLDFLGVLATDGGEASADALLPHVDRALTVDGNGLNFLEQLTTHAPPDGPVRALIADMRTRLDARQTASPAHAFAAELGLASDGAAPFWFTVRLQSVERTWRAIGHATITVDSRSDPWFALWVQRDDGDVDWRYVHGARDDLGLGVPSPSETPSYLARAADLLSLRWDFDGAEVTSSVRGKRRAAIVEWLRRSG